MQLTLEALRVNNNLTQAELAKEFNVSPQTISRMENDSSSISVGLLKKYIEKFQVPFDKIFLGKKYEKI